MGVQDLLLRAARRTPDALAVRGPDGDATHAELDRLADRFAGALFELGVRGGDRVGIWVDKSVGAVAAMQGALRIGAAYVPLDPLAPVPRITTIVRDCSMRALVTTASRAESVPAGQLEGVARLVASEDGWGRVLPRPESRPRTAGTGDDDLAFILYTSGSTGRPKGVCISHRNALAFIEWAAAELDAKPTDRFSNHAPFHFDLSVLDLYVAQLAGASVVLIPDGMSYASRRLVDLISNEAITVWYSVPSALILMMEQGGLLGAPSLPLRAILFAGEPFPIQHLRRLRERWPEPRYLNLYGPTETNVCTFFEVRAIDPGRTQPVPIGRGCSGDRVWAVKEDGTVARAGEEGELMVSGPTVMLGYWGRAPQGDRPYATGDIVRLEESGDYVYVGRRDHMVKVRGHRIELGDIEAALGDHPAIRDVAAAVAGSGIAARIVAFAVGNGGAPPTLLEMKRHCAARLPRSMIVDEVRWLPALPRTRNGKIDRMQLGKHRRETR